MATGMSTNPAQRTIRLIGAPTDAGVGLRGACLGPQALRLAGLMLALQQQGWHVEDREDLQGPVRLMQPAPSGCGQLQEVHIWNRQVFDAVQESLDRGQLPVLLGGDHSLAIGSVAAVAQDCRRRDKPLALVWLDAHADCNTPATSPSGHLHGMPLACLLGYGPEALVQLSGAVPVLRPDQVCLLGVRSIDPGEETFLQSHPVRVVRMRGPQDGDRMEEALGQWLAGIDPDTHVHLSLDLDVLDPVFAPGVSTPEPAGLTAAQALACMRLLGQCRLVGSVDLVELNPARDVHQQTARLGVALLARLLAAPDQNTQSSADVISR